MKTAETYQLKWIRAVEAPQLKMLLLLHCLADENGVVAGYKAEEIATMMGIKFASVFRVIKPLIEQGIVEVTRKGKGSPNTYILNLDKI